VTSQSLFGLSWLDRVGKKLSVKQTCFYIHNNIVTVPGQYLGVAIIFIENKRDFNFCAYMVGFPNPVTNVRLVL